ncbi:hypothetical protein V5F44_20195 [Xanthobacter sp. V2C-8]
MPTTETRNEIPHDVAEHIKKIAGANAAYAKNLTDLAQKLADEGLL